jgi:hypothetical protein
MTGFEVFVSQSIGRIGFDRSGTEGPVEAAFHLIGKNDPGDNPTQHSSYEFNIPGTGQFRVEVDYTPPGDPNSNPFLSEAE